MSRDDQGSVTNEELFDTDFHVVSFGVDANEELYVVVIEDSLYRIVATPLSSVEHNVRDDLSIRVYPNPSGQQSKIEYDLPRPMLVQSEVYNLLGVRVHTLVRRLMPAGTQTVTWEGRDGGGNPVPSGVYYFRLRVGNRFVATRPVVRIR